MKGKLQSLITAAVLFSLGIFLSVSILFSVIELVTGSLSSVLGKFLFSRFSWASLYLPLYLFIAGYVVLKEPFKKGLLFVASFFVFPFLTLSFLLRILFFAQGSFLSQFFRDFFGPALNIVIFSLLIVLEIFIIFRFKDSFLAKWGGKKGVESLANTPTPVEKSYPDEQQKAALHQEKNFFEKSHEEESVLDLTSFFPEKKEEASANSELNEDLKPLGSKEGKNLEKETSSFDNDIEPSLNVTEELVEDNCFDTPNKPDENLNEFNDSHSLKSNEAHIDEDLEKTNRKLKDLYVEQVISRNNQRLEEILNGDDLDSSAKSSLDDEDSVSSLGVSSSAPLSLSPLIEEDPALSYLAEEIPSEDPISSKEWKNIDSDESKDDYNPHTVELSKQVSLDNLNSSYNDLNNLLEENDAYNKEIAEPANPKKQGIGILDKGEGEEREALNLLKVEVVEEEDFEQQPITASFTEEELESNSSISENLKEMDSAENAFEEDEDWNPEYEGNDTDESDSQEIDSDSYNDSEEGSLGTNNPSPNFDSNLKPDQILPIVDEKKFEIKDYKVPVSGILDDYPDELYSKVDDATRLSAEVLKKTLEEFKIEAEVTGIRKGPVITMFEILPAPGIKISRIVNLADNIALRLAASRVRIVAPIPGKHAVGIEVPNKKRSLVSFSEMMENSVERMSGHEMEIPIILGKDISGETQVVDLVKTPHLLIAGATGSGKSVCVNSLICSILYSKSPADVKLIMVDPKIVELKFYNDIPHLLTPVITEPKKALQAIQYCLFEMERRYALLDALGVRDIKSFNKKIKKNKIATLPLPYIVLIIDEFADLMAVSGKELEGVLARLAAMSRAVGIHLVLATQRPSIDVITGLIKANFPSRIAFMVASKFDSRIILDGVGAEKLLGKGDMLFTSSWDPFPQRMQGAFLSEREVENVVDYVKTLGKPEYIDDEIFIDDDESPNGLFTSDEDPLMEKAVEIVCSAGKASASYLQRRLKIGYNRAARLVEDMEERGMVGPQNGSKPREILRRPDNV